MIGGHGDYLDLAGAALSRRDFLAAMQYGLRAVHAPLAQPRHRCDAYLVLALSSLELGAPVDALAYAIGAHLAACRAGDEEREGQASSVVAVVMAHFPQLDMKEATLFH